MTTEERRQKDLRYALRQQQDYQRSINERMKIAADLWRKSQVEHDVWDLAEIALRHAHATCPLVGGEQYVASNHDRPIPWPFSMRRAQP